MDNCYITAVVFLNHGVGIQWQYHLFITHQNPSYLHGIQGQFTQGVPEASSLPDNLDIFDALPPAVGSPTSSVITPNASAVAMWLVMMPSPRMPSSEPEKALSLIRARKGWTSLQGTRGRTGRSGWVQEPKRWSQKGSGEEGGRGMGKEKKGTTLKVETEWTDRRARKGGVEEAETSDQEFTKEA